MYSYSTVRLGLYDYCTLLESLKHMVYRYIPVHGLCTGTIPVGTQEVRTLLLLKALESMTYCCYAGFLHRSGSQVLVSIATRST
jgi:hypothetical protein